MAPEQTALYDAVANCISGDEDFVTDVYNDLVTSHPAALRALIEALQDLLATTR